MRVTVVVAVVLLGLSTACRGGEPARRSGPGEMDHARLKPIRVSGRIVAQGDYLGQPSSLVFVGDNLLILDKAGTPALHLVAAADGRRIRSFGQPGGGPGEYKSAWSLSRDPRDPSQVWVFDLGLGRLTRVDGSAAGSGAPMIISLGGGANPTQPVWINDSLLVSPAVSASGRLTFFDRQGRFVRAAGTIPGDTSKVPSPVLQQAWRGTVVPNPRTGQLALVTRHADQLELFAPDGTPVRIVRGPFRFDPRFTVENIQGFMTMGQGDDMRFGYVTAASDERAIYALFSGRTRAAFQRDAPYGRFVHVYDWNGKMLRVLELDSDLISVSISPDGQWLYGSRFAPEPAVMAYPLASPS